MASSVTTGLWMTTDGGAGGDVTALMTRTLGPAAAAAVGAATRDEPLDGGAAGPAGRGAGFDPAAVSAKTAGAAAWVLERERRVGAAPTEAWGGCEWWPAPIGRGANRMGALHSVLRITAAGAVVVVDAAAAATFLRAPRPGAGRCGSRPGICCPRPPPPPS